MQDEDVLRALLSDGNTPADCVEQALLKVLPEVRKDDSSMRDAIWGVLESADLPETRLRGPRLEIPGETVRVSRILPLDIFTEYHLRNSYGYTASHDDLQQVERILERVPVAAYKQSPWRGRFDMCWVTLEEEIRGRSAAEIADAMGGLRYVGDHMALVSVAYDLPGDALRVPTWFDAAFDPSFLSKSRGASESRAWNWTTSSWGVTEVVHAGMPTFPEGATVTLLGKPGPRMPAPAMSAFAVARSAELEHMIAETLRMSVAHARLAPWLSGEQDILQMTDREFESFMGLLLQRSGYEATVTQPSHDDGFDVIAVRDPPSGQIVLVQAKKTSNTVGIAVLRELIGARAIAERAWGPEYGTAVMMLATTSKMSREVNDKAALFGEEIYLLDYLKIQQQLARFKELGVKDVVDTALARRGELLGRL
jgi:hypothetical protein